MTFHRLSIGTIVAVAIAAILPTVTTAGLLDPVKTVPLTGTITTINAPRQSPARNRRQGASE